MSPVGGYFQNVHYTQFDGSPLQNENCTPTSGANGAYATTSGAVRLNGAHVRNLVKRSEETNPNTPGWSLPDLKLAMTRLTLPFDVRSGAGWQAVILARAAGQYVVLQGDSDRFGNGTCSGAFDGDHCIGVHPGTRMGVVGREWWIDDPICPTGRWERESVLYEYATKFAPKVNFGVFARPVGKVVPPAPPTDISLWGIDVPMNVRALDPSGKATDKAFRRLGRKYGTVINLVDLEHAFNDLGWDYKHPGHSTSGYVNATRQLIAWGAKK